MNLRKCQTLINYIHDKCYSKLPESATAKEWSDIRVIERKKPLCYLITSTIPRWIRVKEMQFQDLIYWFKYRFQNEHKYHLVDTKLEPGYHENDERMLYANFGILEQYIEGELPSMQHWHCDGESDPNWIHDKREAGTKYLTWEIGLVNEDIFNEEQSKSAQEKLDLYLWWKDIRPARLDPWDDMDTEKELSKLNIKSGEKILDFLANRSDEEKEASRKLYDVREKIEKKYHDEDTKMLCRLIKIRKSLWT